MLMSVATETGVGMVWRGVIGLVEHVRFAAGSSSDSEQIARK